MTDKKQDLKTIDLKGKPYVLINERIRYFRETYADGKILTELLSDKDGRCIFKTEIFIGAELVATGHASEKEGDSFINKTSHYENAETSAVGRALAIFGIGVDNSVASYEEVANAIKQQNAPSPDAVKAAEKELIEDAKEQLKSTSGAGGDKTKEQNVSELFENGGEPNW